MLTNNQKEIIDSLIYEFGKMNENKQSKKGFNLIDIAPMQERNTKQAEWREMQRLDALAWEKLAEDECYRIIELLKEDMPNARIEKFGERNGKYELNEILIARQGTHMRLHHSEYVSIEVKVKTERRVDEYGQGYDFGVGFRYIPYPTKLDDACNYEARKWKYNTLEEVFADTWFTDALRKRVL